MADAAALNGSDALAGISSFWIAVALTAPAVLGLGAAWPLWLMRQPMLGNITGTLVIFGAALALIFREHAALDVLVQACLEQGTTCWPAPAPFTRYALYAFIGLAQVMALFTLSIRVESRVRRRGYAQEWR